MAMNSLGLGFVFTARDMATATMTKVEGKLKKLDTTSKDVEASFKKQAGRALGGVALAAGGALALGGAFNLAGQFGQFEQGLAKVGAITRASSSDLEQLRSAAIDAGLSTQFSPTEALQGLEELGLRGFTTGESMNALTGALDLAAGGSIGVGQAAATTAAALRVFGLDASKATESTDKLLKISNLTAIAAGDLELMLGTVARGAGATKQGFDEMLISMGLVKNTGVDASVAASAVSSALQFVASNRSKFEELGVSVTDANGNFRDFIDIVQDTNAQLSNKFPNAADKTSQALDLFGRFGVAAFQAVSSQLDSGIKDTKGNLLVGADAVAYLRNEMEGAAGTAAKFREALLDTFEGQKTLIQGSLQTLGVLAGEAFASSFKGVVSAFNQGVVTLVQVIKNTPAPIKKMLGLLFILTATIAILTGLVIAAVASFTLIKIAVVAFAGPLLAVAGTLAAVAAAGAVLTAGIKILGQAFRENIGGFGDTINKTFSKVRLFFDAVNQLTTGDGKLRGDVLTKLLDPANKSILVLVQRFQQARYRVQRFFDGIRDGYNLVMQSAGPTFAALGDAVRELFAAFGFGDKAMNRLTSSSEDYRLSGARIGMVIGELARLFVGGLTVAVRMATGAIQAMKITWAILSTIVQYTLVPAFAAFMAVLGPLLLLIANVTDAGNGQSFMWIRISHIIGAAIGLFVVYRTVMLAARIAMLAYRAAMMLAAVAQGAFSAVVSAGALAFLGPAGLVVALGAVVYGLTRWIDNLTGATDALADFFGWVTGSTKELNELDDAYRKTLKTRYKARAYDSLAEAAKDANMSTEAYASQRAKKIAGEQTAKALGLSESEIKRRLLEGEDPYKELAKKAVPPAAAADGQVAAATGEANKAKAQAQLQGDATAAALERVQGGGGKPIQLNVTTKLGDQEIANLNKLVANAEAAANFQVDALPLGDF